MRKSPNPCMMVIFGGDGDLAKRKLYPALYNLKQDKLLPQSFAVVGFARKEKTNEEFRKGIIEGLKQEIPKSLNLDVAQELVSHFSYYRGDSTNPESFKGLKDYLVKTDLENKTQGSMLFYLATPPKLFSEIPKHLSEQGLLEEGQFWRRVIIEKPFGHDFDSAVKLNQGLAKEMKESQIYRIDHYLGKETVQNMMVLRFANGIFEPIWNRRYVDSIQISVAETLGVEDRGGYYDSSGALRDMVPNHLFQLLAMAGMEPPSSFVADEIRDEKVKVLKSIKTLTPEMVHHSVIRGQYGSGEMTSSVGSVGRVPSYRDESNVAKDSATETFVAMKLEVDNWRWAGIPFYLRTGKRLAQRSTEVVVQFKRVPLEIFKGTGVDGVARNQLIIKIQPEEGIVLRMASKIPGPDFQIQEVAMNFSYEDYFGKKPNTGYETLLFDCMNGDQTLFQRADQIEIGWKVIDPILKLWAKEAPTNFPNYASGTWGPAESMELVQGGGCHWRNEG